MTFNSFLKRYGLKHLTYWLTYKSGDFLHLVSNIRVSLIMTKIKRQFLEMDFLNISTFNVVRGTPLTKTVILTYHIGASCAQCKQPINGRCVSAMGKRFHPNHFICNLCREPLTQGIFKEHLERAYCHPCFRKIGWFLKHLTEICFYWFL